MIIIISYGFSNIFVAFKPYESHLPETAKETAQQERPKESEETGDHAEYTI